MTYTMHYPLVDIKELLAGAVERCRQPLVDQVQVVVRCIGIVRRRVLQSNKSNLSRGQALTGFFCHHNLERMTGMLSMQECRVISNGHMSDPTCSCFSRAPAAMEALRLPRRTSCDTLPRLAGASPSASAASTSLSVSSKFSDGHGMRTDETTGFVLLAFAAHRHAAAAGGAEKWPCRSAVQQPPGPPRRAPPPCGEQAVSWAAWATPPAAVWTSALLHSRQLAAQQ